MPSVVKISAVGAAAAVILAAAAMLASCESLPASVEGNGVGAGVRTGGGSIPDGAKVSGLVRSVSGDPLGVAVVAASATAPVTGTTTTGTTTTVPTTTTTTTDPTTGSSGGTVTVSPDGGIVGVRVTLGAPDGQTLVTYTDQTGRFAFDSPYQGVWPISFELGAQCNSTQVDVNPLGGKRTEVVAGLVVSGTALTPMIRGPVSLQITSSTAPTGPVPGVLVRAISTGAPVPGPQLVWVMKTATDAALVPMGPADRILVASGAVTGDVEVTVQLAAYRSNSLVLALVAGTG
jgi:hypothetical protein